MSTELSKDSSQELSFKESAQPLSLDQQLKTLAKFGGFKIIEALVEEVSKIDPAKKAMKSIFLSEQEYEPERESLADKLKILKSLFEGVESSKEATTVSENQARETKALYEKNLSVALESTQGLETSYRSLDFFFKNAKEQKIKDLTLVNADVESLSGKVDGTYLTDERYVRAIEDELKSGYDRFNMKDNYSMLVLPGWLGHSAVVDRFARIAHENKTMLLTDYRDLTSVDEVTALFAKENLSGGDEFRANVMMSANWVVGRKKIAEGGETEDLFVPPSAALAGKLYSTPISQVAAGKKFGGLVGVTGVRFPTRKSDVSLMDSLGIIPMITEWEAMSFSGRTLFNGDNVGLQVYSVVRTFDYLSKVLMDFLNRRTFENISEENRRNMRDQISRYLDEHKGPGKLIQDFRPVKVDKGDRPDRVKVLVDVDPYFPARSFIVKLEGTKQEWGSSYDQKS